MSIADEVLELYRRRGDEAYFGEAVSQTEHALQAAHLAETEAAPDSLVVAALVHDIGHLLHSRSEDIADRGIDARHEEIGRRWLSRHFGPEVVEPVQLHVAAKRYLCAVDPDYMAELSPASVQSLRLQGGPFTEDDVRDFRAHAHFDAAVRLRRWDDEAKVPGHDVPGLEHYRDLIARTAYG